MKLLSNKEDLLEGNLFKKIFIFILPLIISNMVQKLFNAVDIAVLGHMASSVAVASVGATTSIGHLLVDTFFGISAGAKIVLSRSFGSKDAERIKRASYTTILTGLGLGLILVVPGLLFSENMLRFVDCPPECFEQSVLYLKIYCAGAPAIMLYNFASSILLASGDTRRPMLYITISGIVNLCLNIILCLVLEKKVMAVAIATVVSQLVSAVLVCARLRKIKEIELGFKNICFDGSVLGKIFYYGAPVALYTAIFPLSNLQIQSAINSFGVSAVSGNSAGITVEGFVAAVSTAISSATVTFMGQGIGAKRFDKSKKSLLLCLGYTIVLTGFAGVFAFLTGRFWTALIIPDDPVGIDYAMIRLSFVGLFHAIAGVNGVLSHAIQSYGKPIFSTVNSIVGVFIFRFVWMRFVYPLYPTYTCLMVCFIASWCFMLIFNILGTIFFGNRFYKRAEREIS